MKILFAAVLMVLAGCNPSPAGVSVSDYKGERVVYLISPVGRSEYEDQGMVNFEGRKLNLIIFKTKVLVFEDTEKIYCNPQDLLPYRIERNISNVLGKEYIIEEYDQRNFIVTTKKFKRGKLVSKQTTKTGGPIHNAIILPFYLRRFPDLKIGWHFTVRVPNKFEIELVSIEEIKVPAGKFQAYHFKSMPDKFEIWVNKNNPRVPLKIEGKGVFDYALLMGEYSFNGK